MKLQIWIVVACIFTALGGHAQRLGPIKPIVRTERSLIRQRAPKLPAIASVVKEMTEEETKKAIAALPFRPVPKKATLFSIIPGGGQIYNHDYWKLPLVYAAFGGAMYMVRWNTVRYRDYLSVYLTSVDLNTGDPSGKTEYEVYIRSRKTTYTLTLDNVRRGKDFYRRYRDWGYALLGASFALSAIEANVAAHLKTFDVSDDLTLRIEPSLRQPLAPQPALGVRLVFGLRSHK